MEWPNAELKEKEGRRKHPGKASPLFALAKNNKKWDLEIQIPV